jgi:aminopeptidase
VPKPSATPEGLAASLLGGALGVRAGESVLVESWSHTLPYAAACVVEARRRGARPVLLLEEEGAFWQSLENGSSPAQLGSMGRHEWALLGATDAYVYFPGPADRPRMDRLPQTQRAALSGYMGEWFRRARRAGLRGVRSALGYASDSMADFWGIDAETWRQELVDATVGADLKEIRGVAQRVSRAISRGKELRITAANGTDVRLGLRHRSPFADDGVIGVDDRRAGRPMTTSPPGNVVVAIDERSAEGIVVANRPSYVRSGRLESGQWEFERGRLVRASHGEGGLAWEEHHAKAPRGKEVASLFGLGLNRSIAPGTPQVEDQEAGAVTVAIGGNAPYGGSNRCPYLSWLVVGEAMVAVDGRPLADRGQLL